MHGITEIWDENSDDSDTVEKMSAFFESNNEKVLIEELARFIWRGWEKTSASAHTHKILNRCALSPKLR